MKNILIFIGGATLGGVATTIYFKRKINQLEEEYIRIANDEINKYIKPYEPDESVKIDLVEEDNDKIGEIVSKYVSTSEDIKVNNIEESSEIQEEDINKDDLEEDEQVALYLITPEEFGDDEYYDTKILRMFKNKVVLDEDDCIVDIDYFGEDVLSKLYSKKSKDNSIFVRDENDKVDYEVIKEHMNYDDYLNRDNQEIK